MKRYILAGLFACMMVACQDYPEVIGTPTAIELPMGVKPGTRLQPKLLLADDGTIFLHPTIWVDSEFGECTFRTAEDGSYRCLPFAPPQIDDYYVDASCAQRAFLWVPTGMCDKPTDRVLQRAKEDVCGKDERWAAYRITATSDKGSLYHFQSNGLCGKFLTINGSADGTIMIMGEKLDAADFVSAWR